MKLIVPILPQILGIGCVGAVVLPWVNWTFEKKRTLQASRRELLEKCRDLIDAGLSMEEFRQTSAYARIRPLLSAQAQELIDRDLMHITVVMGQARNSGDPFKTTILDELSALEKKWRLV